MFERRHVEPRICPSFHVRNVRAEASSWSDTLGVELARRFILIVAACELDIVFTQTSAIPFHVQSPCTYITNTYLTTSASSTQTPPLLGILKTYTTATMSAVSSAVSSVVSSAIASATPTGASCASADFTRVRTSPPTPTLLNHLTSPVPHHRRRLRRRQHHRNPPQQRLLRPRTMLQVRARRVFQWRLRLLLPVGPAVRG